MENLIRKYQQRLARETDPLLQAAAVEAIAKIRATAVKTAYAVTTIEKKIISRRNETVRKELPAPPIGPVEMLILSILTLQKIARVRVLIGTVLYEMTGREFRCGLILYYDHILAAKGEVAPFCCKPPEKAIPFKDEAPKRSDAWKLLHLTKLRMGKAKKVSPSQSEVKWEKKTKPTFSTAHITVEKTPPPTPTVKVRPSLQAKAKAFKEAIVIVGEGKPREEKPYIPQAREKNNPSPREFNSPFKIAFAGMVRKGQ